MNVGYGRKVLTDNASVSVSSSKSNMNSNGTSYQNGLFVNVDEEHNNTKNMTLSGFNQVGGKVTGNIENLTIESKQNTSTTTGSTKGGSIGFAPNGIPTSISANYSQTNGERKYVDDPTTFIIGEGSNLKVGKVENTAAAMGTSGNGKLSIDEYVGHNLENKDKTTTKGGSLSLSQSSIPISGVGVNYANRDLESVTKNTVVGNVEIGKSSGDEINKDLSTMTEVTKDEDTKTNVFVESQTIRYAVNPDSFKEDLQKAKNEIHDIYHAVDSTVNPQGKESRNVLEQLAETRQAKTIYNVVDSRLQIAENQEDIAKAFEGVSEDLGYKVKVIYTDPSNSPQLIGVDKNGNKYIKDGTAYVDKDTGIGYILINTKSPANKTKAGVIGTIAEEQSHVIGKIEGRQKTVPDGSEKGLESLGRPTNDYFKNQYSKNDKAIGIKSDGRDYSNVDFGENVGDNSLALEVGTIVKTGAKTGIGMAAAGVSTPVLVIGGVIIGAFYYTSMPEEQKEQLKEEIYEIYQDVKKSFGSILDKESSKNLVADVIKYKLKEKGIEADVKIDKDGNVMYTLSPLPEDMKKQWIPPIPLPLPEEEKNPRIPPMDPPKEETEKEKWEREEKARREEQEFFNELQKPNGIPIPKEQPVKIYTITKNEANEMYKEVEGKNKVTNIPKNLTKKEMENNKNKANSKILDKQLQNAGVKKPDYNCAAHHLVSDATMPKATKALNKYGIEINSATNGVYLPTPNADTSKVTTEVVHSGPNGKEYKELLEKSIPDIAENMENANASYDEIQAALENELNNTRIKLLTGELKINNAKFKTTEKGKK